MSESLARDGDLLSNTQITGGALRDFFLTLINANDKRYEQRFIAQELALHNALLVRTERDDQVTTAIKEYAGAMLTQQDRRLEQYATNAAVALDTARASAVALLLAKEAAVNDQIESQHRESAVAINSVRETMSVSLTNQATAVAKAEDANEKRFASVNEFRATLSDQATKFIARSEVEQRFTSMNEKIVDMSSRMDRNEGRGSGLNAGWGYLVAGLGLLLTVVSVGVAVLVFFMRKG